jgi:hypothetical protein
MNGIVAYHPDGVQSLLHALGKALPYHRPDVNTDIFALVAEEVHAELLNGPSEECCSPARGTVQDGAGLLIVPFDVVRHVRIRQRRIPARGIIISRSNHIARLEERRHSLPESHG